MTAATTARRAALTVALCAGVALSHLHTSVAAAITPERAFEILDAQRAANGIPPLPLNQSLLRSECSLENHHIASSDIHGWTTTTSPWQDAPLHESFLFDPNAIAGAYGEFPEFRSKDPTFPTSHEQWACMWFEWAPESPSPTGTPQFYAAVGGAGPGHVPVSEAAYEYPFTPGATVGLPEGTATGPNLLVYALGMGGAPSIASARLETTNGASVAARKVDSRTEYHGSAFMFPWRGILIPVKPLAYSTAYQATIVWSGAEGQATQRFTFTTIPQPILPAFLRLRIAHIVRHGSTATVTLAAPNALLGQRITAAVNYFAQGQCHTSRYGRECTLSGRRGKSTTAVLLTSFAFHLYLKRRPPFVLEVHTPPFVAGFSRYAASRASEAVFR